MPLIKKAAKVAVGVGYFATLLKDVKHEILAEFVKVRQM